MDGYTVEKSTLMLIALMKAHGVRRVIASPGMRNMCLVASLQVDSDFEVYSSVDERSAAYMACGMAAETGEPVALSCTGATASRNYMPGLTEAYYRKLPVLAITSTKHVGELGQLHAQTVDRRQQPNDIVRYSAQIPMTRCPEDELSNNILINTALLELRRSGGGPVHINLETECNRDFSVSALPDERVIRRIDRRGPLPQLKPGKVGIFVGAYGRWSERLTSSVDEFCEKYDAVVFCDQTGKYDGAYGVNPTIVLSQRQYKSQLRKVTTLIHIGDVSGASYIRPQADSVWRVSPDGEVRDMFGRLRYVFDMWEDEFFEAYNQMTEKRVGTSFCNAWRDEVSAMSGKMPELPFSNGWLASKTLPKVPQGSVLHLGILNSLRMWNFFERPSGVACFSNTGGFGIDGIASTLIGAALTSPDKLFIGVLGDLAFFYDMNSLGNRHVPGNVRLLLVNNGMGIEFKNYNHPAATLGKRTDPFIAAAGHYGRKSPDLVRHYASDLGFKYLTASSKEEFSAQVDEFISPEDLTTPIVFEVFTDEENENATLRILRNIETSASGATKDAIRRIVGEKGVAVGKRILGL